MLSDDRLIFISSASVAGLAPVWESADQGDTWAQIGEVRGPPAGDSPHGAFNENHVLELSPGRLLVVFRTEFGYLHQSNSEDGGHTWSDLKPMPVWGCPPHLIGLSSGPILCVYGHRRDPYGIRGVVSYDDGQTWDHENIITIYEFDQPWDIGYPVSLEVTPGHILTAYYCNRKQKRKQKVGPSLAYSDDPGGILYTHWTLQGR